MTDSGDGGVPADVPTASRPAPKRRWRDDLRLLRRRDLGLVLVSRLVSDFGTGIAPIALAFGVLALPGGSASALGLVLLCAALPRLVFLLVGGVIGDRVRSRARLMAWAEAAAGAAHLVAGVLFLTGHATVPALAALAAVGGAAASLYYPTSTGLVPQLATGDDLQSANALMRLSSSIAGILGTAMGGILVATVGPGWGLVVDAATYAVSAVLLTLVRARAAQDRVGERGSPLDDLVHGWREFVSRRWVWLIVLLFALSNFGFTAGIAVLGPVLSLQEYSGATGWATVMVSFALGTLVGVVVAMRLKPVHPLLVGMIAQVVVASPLVAMAVPTSLPVLVVVSFVCGVGVDVFEIMWITSLQQHVPQESLSRVSSYDWLGSLALTPVALALAGPLAGWLGLQGALWVCAALGAAACLGLLDPQIRGLRAVPTEAPQTA
ncbi:MAG TPA: MFS transporter [Candidatus Nanopelagicales bacterium]|nr:MFS transporter [Candidatus Nanopelagicales bacterium]